MNLDNILKSLTSTKKGAIVIILIFVAIFITNNISFFKSISINITNDKKESSQKPEEKENDNKTPTPVRASENSMHISISDVIYQNEFLNSPSYLLFTVKNTSYNSIDSLDKIIIRVIHGSVLMYSVALPSDITINYVNDTITEFTKLNFSRSSMINIYLLLNNPTFERIEVKLFKYDTIKEIIYLQKDIIKINNSTKDDRWYNFTIFLLFVLGLVIITIVIMGIVLLQSLLSRKKLFRDK